MTNLVMKLVDSYDPILSEKLERFNFNEPPINPSELAVILTETMLSHNGIGLPANQVGMRHRAFVIRSDPIICCFNPIIVDHSTTTNVLDEGCLSFSGMILKIPRYDSIRIRYTLPNGETKTEVFKGMTSRIMQHETDHLDGITFHKRASKVHLALAKAKAKSKL